VPVIEWSAMETPSCENEAQTTGSWVCSNATWCTLRRTRKTSRAASSPGSDAITSYRLMTTRYVAATSRRMLTPIHIRMSMSFTASFCRWRPLSSSARDAERSTVNGLGIPNRSKFTAPRSSARFRAVASPRTHRPAASSRCPSPASLANPRRSRISQPLHHW